MLQQETLQPNSNYIANTIIENSPELTSDFRQVASSLAEASGVSSRYDVSAFRHRSVATLHANLL